MSLCSRGKGAVCLCMKAEVFARGGQFFFMEPCVQDDEDGKRGGGGVECVFVE